MFCSPSFTKGRMIANYLPFLLLLQSTPSTSLPLYTGTVYVLIPDVHRSGGPACLHSLHAQLNQMAVTSYMFNLLPQYTTPHSRSIPLSLLSNADQPLTSMPQVLATKPLVIDYLINHLTPHDWIVVPTHWIDSDYFTQEDMERFSNTGARTLVYLLGVAYPWISRPPATTILDWWWVLNCKRLPKVLLPSCPCPITLPPTTSYHTNTLSHSRHWNEFTI